MRFFYPSDASVATNWANFETSGIAQAERATTTDRLVRTLRSLRTLRTLLASVAPDIKVYATKDPPPVVNVNRPADSTGLSVAFWRHAGVGLPTSTQPRTGGPYWSRRVILPLRAGALPQGANDPQSPPRVDLGAGVSAVIPTALWMRLPSDSATLVVVAPIARSPELSINDQSVRLAAGWRAPRLIRCHRCSTSRSGAWSRRCTTVTATCIAANRSLGSYRFCCDGLRATSSSPA